MSRKEYTRFLFEQLYRIEELATQKQAQHISDYDLGKQRDNLRERITIQLDLLEAEIVTALDSDKKVAYSTEEALHS